MPKNGFLKNCNRGNLEFKIFAYESLYNIFNIQGRAAKLGLTLTAHIFRNF